MKKLFLLVVIILIVIIIIIAVKIGDNVIKANNISKFNEKIESIYKNKTVYGADIVTIINKAIDNNKAYDIKKDENGNYINDDKYCLKVELILLNITDKKEIKEVHYPMETLKKARTRWIYFKLFINCI